MSASVDNEQVQEVKCTFVKSRDNTMIQITLTSKEEISKEKVLALLQSLQEQVEKL